MKNQPRLTAALKSRNRGLLILLVSTVGIFYAVSYVKTGLSLKHGAGAFNTHHHE
jgi:hypothetical protein